MDQRYIRNFSIIAHIDHGKSTLADRFLELTGALQAREMEAQVLDSMDLERERGITIKAHAVRLTYRANDGQDYILNLIDTPGHVDFSYEVTRSLAACEGALLLVDASQGVEAQTLANAYLAVENNLEIIPVINKIDLPGAQPEEARRQIEEIIGLDASQAILASAKEGRGVAEILEAIVHRLPPPTGVPDAPLKALIFDSWYDPYRGVVILTRVIDGVLRPGQKIRLMITGQEFQVDQLGVFSPKPVPVTELGVGEAGFMVANIKNVADAKIGDTITEVGRPTDAPFPGFKELKPMVFAGLYPVEGSKYAELREALEKLRLNDASFFFEPETSAALGFGFRCGFLGLLHMEIVQERLEREFDQDLITTAPGVLYRVTTTDGVVHEIDSPAKLPDPGRIEKFEEPVITAMMLTPNEHVGGILELCQEKRGIQKGLEYVSQNRVLITYEMPFNEVVLDFYDRLKTISRGYASLDYHVTGYWESPLVKLDILVNAEPVDALSMIVHEENAYARGRAARLEDARAHPAPDVRGRHSGRYRQPHRRARNRQRASKERAREMLRRRHLAQTEAAREAEGRQEAHEARGSCRDPAGSVPCGAESRARHLTEVRSEKPEVRSEVRNGEAPGRKSVVREYFESLVIAVILALFVRTWVFQAFKIPSGSMEPNLLIGDHLIVNKMAFAPTATAVERAVLPHRDIRRGDIIVFKSPEEPDRDLIKRVIGLPGDRLELRRKRMYVNGNRLDEPYVQFLEPLAEDAPSKPGDLREEYGPVTVPEGQYFMMGDNRDNSQDSRYWGFLPMSYVKGRALFIYFSADASRSIVDLFGGIRWSRLLDPVR